jgi:hypothetical protein
MRMPHIVALVVSLLLLTACGDDAVAPSKDAGTGVATLKWDPPTRDEIGEPLTDLVAYHILYGRTADDLRYSIRIDDPAQNSATITGLGRGQWFFAIVAVNSAGRPSKRSNVASKEVR